MKMSPEYEQAAKDLSEAHKEEMYLRVLYSSAEKRLEAARAKVCKMFEAETSEVTDRSRE